MEDSLERLGRMRLTLNITVAGLLLLLGVSLCVLYALLPTYQSLLIFIAAVIAGVSTVYSGYYVAKTLKIQVEQRRVDNAFKLIEKLNEADFMTVVSFMDGSLKYEAIPPGQLYKSITADEKLHCSLKKILNALEALSIAIQMGYADENTLLMDSKTTVCFYWSKFEPYIEERRRQKSTTLYRELEALAKCWHSGRLLSASKKL